MNNKETTTFKLSNQPMDKNTYYTPNHVAIIFKVAPGTIYRWVEEKKLTCVKIGRLIRFTQEDLDKFTKKI